jgi:hypothetical protein
MAGIASLVVLPSDAEADDYRLREDASRRTAASNATSNSAADRAS